MPFYIYEVLDENGEPIEQIEVFQKISDEPLTEHPETGQPVQKVITGCFIGGSWSDSAMKKNVSDDKKLDKLGFTKYVKAGDGYYEKRAGDGPNVIHKDNPITAKDLKKYD